MQAVGGRSEILTSVVFARLVEKLLRNALARAVFLCQVGEIRDRSFEQQRYRASGLTLVTTAAIALWNNVYIERAIQTSISNGQALDPELSARGRSSRPAVGSQSAECSLLGTGSRANLF